MSSTSTQATTANLHSFPPPGLMHLGPRPPAVFVRGQGSWL
jgi:hypothetical protein